ncbi:hypothetical protein X753_16725 [Mesorhizobium sp. LNJC399B00]|nr:hypothetical protein X770_12730 [Mesorhizobium sp. LSJC269B00]ESY05221.1 hypothetical protein X753_16725 [Mesorhizobium sp. LNJC399B00]ESZ31775.1 hypothetical protein X733_19905 [Mesorhizobium sp. L2C067A000]
MMTKWHVARGARADAEINNKIFLIKNVSEMRATYQVRLLLYRAVQEGTRLVLDLPKECKLSANLKALAKEHRRNFEITRT